MRAKSVNSNSSRNPGAMSLTTLNDIFFTAVERNLERLMLYRENGNWLPISSSDFGRKVAHVVQTLQRWGIRKGDRVAILSENRPEWSIADFAILLAGAVTVPVYATLTPEQTAYTLRDSGARLVFVSTEHQLRKVHSILAQTEIQRIVVMDRVQVPAELAPVCTLMDEFAPDGTGVLDGATEAFARSITPEDLATIIYTSGTTGVSKGAMLTHGNMASNIACSLRGFDMHPGQTSISFLPLSHVTARHVDFAMLYHGVTLAYCPFLEDLPTTFLEVRSYGVRFRAKNLREDLRQSRDDGSRLPEACNLPVGAVCGPRQQARNSRGRDPEFMAMETGEQIGLFKNSRRRRWPSRNLHLRRSTAGPRTRRMVRHRRHSHS